MTKKDIIRMAREAGAQLDKHNGGFIDQSVLLRFAAFVAAAATEEANRRSNASWSLMCEKMVKAEREAMAKEWETVHGFDKYGVAASIRARKD